MGIEYSGITSRPASMDELATFMRGDDPQVMDGGVHDEYARGITTENPSDRLIDGDPRIAQTERTFNRTPAQEQDWKGAYGREANEKGQWRRTAEEAIADLNRAKAELDALLARGYAPAYAPQGSAGGAGNGGYSNVPSSVLPTQPQLPDRFFPDRSEEDIVQVKDVEQMLRTMVAPAVFGVARETAMLQQKQLEGTKAQLGITPEVEGTLVRRYPWLNAVGDPYARLSAMQELVRGNTPPPASTSTPGVAAAARRVTYVENSQPSTNDADVTAEMIVQRELAEAMAKPFGHERSEALRKAFIKNGMGSGNDFGPGVLTR